MTDKTLRRSGFRRTRTSPFDEAFDGPAGQSWHARRPAVVRTREPDHFRPGRTLPANLNGGDVIFTSVRDPLGWAIRVGQHSRFRLYGFGTWDHCAIVLDHDHLIDSTGRGVRVRETARYYPRAHRTVARLDLSDAQRDVVGDYLACQLHHERQYNKIASLGLFLRLLTGSSLILSMGNSYTCSQLVSDALGHAGLIFRRPPPGMLPADLARDLRVAAPVKWYKPFQYK